MPIEVENTNLEAQVNVLVNEAYSELPDAEKWPVFKGRKYTVSKVLSKDQIADVVFRHHRGEQQKLWLYDRTIIHPPTREQVKFFKLEEPEPARKTKAAA